MKEQIILNENTFFIFSLTPNFRRISRALGLESENIKSKVRRFTREPRSYMSSQLPGQIQKCPNDFRIFPNDIQIFQVNFRRFRMRFRNLHVNFRFNKFVLMMNCSPPNCVINLDISEFDLAIN